MNPLRGSDAFLVLLLACVVKITCLLGLAWLLASVARHRSAALRHWIWLLGILGSLALPFLTLLLPAWRSGMLSLPKGMPGNPVSQTLHSITIDVVAASPRLHIAGRAVFCLWAAGFAVVALRLAAGMARLVSVSARSRPLLEKDWLLTVSEFSDYFQIKRSVRLIDCGSVAAVPQTWGIFRPLILLPAVARDWPERRRRIVIGHELAHVARNDWMLQILAELARSLYWFHPLAWKAAKGLREQSECACDDSVLNCGIDASQYANELLDLVRTLQRSSHAWSAALAFSRPSSFERRLTSMLNPSKNRRHLPGRAKLLAVFSALCLLLPLAAIHLPAQPASERFTGMVYDPSGSPVSDATITMTNSDSTRIEITRSGSEGSFKFAALVPGQYELKVTKPGFAEYKVSRIIVPSGQESAQNVNLKAEVVRVTLKVVGEGKAAADKPPLHVGGEILEPRLLNRSEPEYPQAAKAAGIEGTVLLNAIIGKKGNLLSLRVMNSEVDPALASAALKAVSQWQYTPVLLNGDPIEVETTVTVNFKLESKAN